MSYQYNPFRPNCPVFSGMFAGRVREIERTDEILFQTTSCNPTHIMIHGERGIGKSSLMLVANYFAKGDLSWAEKKHNFLTIQFNISENITLIDLAIKIKNLLDRELKKVDKAYNFGSSGY